AGDSVMSTTLARTRKAPAKLDAAPLRQKIGIVGGGMGGSASAVALGMSGAGREVALVDVLVHDQRAILTICACVSGVPDCDGITLALPHLIGGEGVLATIPLALADTEREGLRRSAGILRDAVASLQLDL